MLFSFLAFNKVYSPQYALWVLPFLAMIAVRWGWWVTFWVLDPILFVGLFRWYATGSDLLKQAATIGVWGKSVLFVLLSVVVLVTPLALRRQHQPAEPAPQTADPPAPRHGESADPAESDVEAPEPAVA
jgi:hypothetical protein